jgi:hypothetical protein
MRPFARVVELRGLERVPRAALVERDASGRLHLLNVVNVGDGVTVLHIGDVAAAGKMSEPQQIICRRCNAGVLHAINACNLGQVGSSLLAAAEVLERQGEARACGRLREAGAVFDGGGWK